MIGGVSIRPWTIELKKLQAILTVIERSDVKGRTDLLMKTSLVYGKCQGNKTINPYLDLLLKRNLISEGGDKTIRITDYGRKLLVHVNSAVSYLE